MNPANTLLTDAFGRVAESVPAVVSGLTAEQLSYRVDAEANPVGWLVWHLTRVMDDHLATLASTDQVYRKQGYAARFGLDLDDGDIGYGHDTDQVAAVRVDGAGLSDYHAAVQEAFAPYLAEVSDFDRVVDANWDPPVTVAARLVSVADEVARHTGQAEFIRGLLDRGAITRHGDPAH